MNSIHDLKRADICETPLLLFECRIASGMVERWSTHGITFNGETYLPRVIRHNMLEMRSAAESGVDAFSRLTITLANADSHFSQIARNAGWKGAKLSVKFVFFDVNTGEAASESAVVFRGIANPPDEITESTIRLTFTSRMNLQRILLPQIRIQRRCPWMFPSTPEQRAEANAGGTAGVFSPFYRCGYSPDAEGGCGNMNGAEPYKSCDYTRAQCVERGMFDKDASGRETRRFGGVEFIPPTIQVKAYGEKGTHASGGVENEAKYNDFVPMVYGTAWFRPPVVFARNDGNLTHMEVLLGTGEISNVLKVVVNGNELPPGETRSEHITSTGWFNIVSLGARNGAFNLDFKDGSGVPAGDPYGSMAVLSVVVPNRISDGSALPKIDVLVEGLKLPTFDASGAAAGIAFTRNPAWILLDLLRRSGWDLSEIDLKTFANAAAYCSETVETTNLHGNPQSIARFGCNLVVRNRRSAADVIRGVRNGAGLYLTYGLGGLLELHPESSLAVQQPEKPDCSNSEEMLNGGWPAFEFGDGTNGFSDILRRGNGEPTVRVWSRSTAESPNRYSVEFQDEFNEYQHDSMSLVDVEDAVQSGEEISASLLALGIPNFNQAGRVLRLHLDRSLRGNTYVDFETGLRGIGLKPGDLITITYAKEGFDRQPFRIIRVSPGLNYSSIAITAQIHEDVWFDGNGESTGLIGGGRQTGLDTTIPRPLAGVTIDSYGDTQFTIEESTLEKTDGGYEVDVAASFALPNKVSVGAPSISLLSLAAQISSSGGTLNGGQTYYYAITAVQDGLESRLSFLMRATVRSGSDANTVTLSGFSFAPGTSGFNVYRGKNPLQLLLIAENEPVAASFIDDGKSPEPISPPDPNFHHANFYWRLELQPEAAASIYSQTTIGNDTLGMNPNEYRGKIVRITQGKGKGQERIIASNDATTLELSTGWEVAPDDSSVFVIAEPVWTFGGHSQTSPAVFRIPNRAGVTVHVSGRAASVHDRECAMEISPLTRHAIGGAAADQDVPPMPLFGLRCMGGGLVEISGIGFDTFENTRSITAANLTVHYRDELSTAIPTSLNAAVDAAATTLLFSTPVTADVGSLLQIGDEIVIVQNVSNDGLTCNVDRGACASRPAEHDVSSPVWSLSRRISILSFVPGFFGTPASGSYSHTLTMPDIRISAAEMSVINVRGTSQARWASYAETPDNGLRTLSGGQIVLQVDGAAAIQANATAGIVVDASHAVRDVCATVTESPSGSDLSARLTLDGLPWCTLTIADGETVSNVIEGATLGSLRAGVRIGLDIINVGQTLPGTGLSVSIRL
jgi:hypothetical protein